MQHTGRAVVFEDIDDYKARINDDALDIDETCIMVLKNCGPRGYPGMAEVGNMGLPPKVLKKGITDMIRLSDARMSGTAYGTVILHTSPEAAVGGPLAVVRTGDMIEVDVPGRRIHLDITEEDLAARLAGWSPSHEQAVSGYEWLHQTHVGGADTGDFGGGAEQGVGHLAGDHVDLVGVGDGDQHVGVFGAGFLEHPGIAAHAEHGANVQTVPQFPQALAVDVDDGDVVAFPRQVLRQGAAHLAGTENDDLHDRWSVTLLSSAALRLCRQAR